MIYLIYLITLMDLQPSENCAKRITIHKSSFEKKYNCNFRNLNAVENEVINKFLEGKKTERSSFLDFYCPKCKQAN